MRSRICALRIDRHLSDVARKIVGTLLAVRKFILRQADLVAKRSRARDRLVAAIELGPVLDDEVVAVRNLRSVGTRACAGVGRGRGRSTHRSVGGTSRKQQRTDPK